MAEKSKSIFICAGDPSGDIAGSHLIRELKSHHNSITTFGLGGKRMLALGQKQLIDGDQLAVLGFWEVAKKYLFFRKLMLDTVKLIEEKRPRLIILIDYPGFNLRLAERIKKYGIPIVYYISPQIWAWAPKRINQIKRLVDKMLLILPFETDIYNNVNLKNCFVGHYLLDDMDEKYIKAPYDINSNLITLMPGSRPQEIERMLPTLLQSTELISQMRDFQFTVAAIENNVDYEKYLRNCNVPVKIVTGQSRELIYKSRLVIVSSGTATLETGIIGRPMIVIYKTGWLTYLIARSLVKINNIALINIASGETIVPELIQSDASPENILVKAERYLSDDDYCKNIVEKLHRTVDKLGGPGSAGRAYSAIEEYL
ncbi:MAG: lipid-A-disaccharide synthase [Candidatus Zixiibacteriota bacterium]